ncbi:hypothetical protein PVK06_046481 [Gossypium arboreum]|uniref:Uncharacterized protein n=1 Tax=Gossypium arboreum TaxID=29729 RepID=A0ABR0MAR7_GOSAR|nr:hypothetical protein PVK06_046481 [Gossypium arboreum]
MESNHAAVIIEDDDNNSVGHSIAFSSKDLVHAMRRVGTSMHEITKREFKVWKKQGCVKSSRPLLSNMD